MLVPVTTIGGLATGVGAVSNALQSCRSLESGRSGSLTLGSLSFYGSVTSPGRAMQSSHSSLDSDEDHDNGMASLEYDTTEVQEIFTELLEIFDASAPSSQQQQRAMNNLWSFYASHADELEACAQGLEAMLCNRHAPAIGQALFPRVSTSPSNLASQQVHRRSNIKNSDTANPARWNLLPRRSRSMS